MLQLDSYSILVDLHFSSKGLAHLCLYLFVMFLFADALLHEGRASLQL